MIIIYLTILNRQCSRGDEFNFKQRPFETDNFVCKYRVRTLGEANSFTDFASAGFNNLCTKRHHNNE